MYMLHGWYNGDNGTIYIYIYFFFHLFISVHLFIYLYFAFSVKYNNTATVARSRSTRDVPTRAYRFSVCCVSRSFAQRFRGSRHSFPMISTSFYLDIDQRPDRTWNDARHPARINTQTM